MLNWSHENDLIRQDPNVLDQSLHRIDPSWRQALCLSVSVSSEGLQYSMEDGREPNLHWEEPVPCHELKGSPEQLYTSQIIFECLKLSSVNQSLVPGMSLVLLPELLRVCARPLLCEQRGFHFIAAPG